jgi:RNA polymerase sigma-70 factor, ECF subfamily
MGPFEMRVWNETHERLKAFVFRITKDRALTDDIIQDVYLKVHSKVGQLRAYEKLTSWIFQITRNAIIDHLRSCSKTIQIHDIDWDCDQKPLNDCVASCLQTLMTTLPKKYREALELTEFKNLSQLELAEALNLSYSGAKSRVQRARKLLKEKLESEYLVKFDAYGNVVICKRKHPSRKSA